MHILCIFFFLTGEQCSSFVFSMLIFSNLSVYNGILADFCPLRNGSVLAASILILYLLEIYWLDNIVKTRPITAYFFRNSAWLPVVSVKVTRITGDPFHLNHPGLHTLIETSILFLPLSHTFSHICAYFRTLLFVIKSEVWNFGFASFV